MHRHHRDRRFGGITAAEVFLGNLPLLLQAQVAQPVGRGCRLQPLAVHLLLHQLGRLLEIPQGPAAQGQTGQAVAAEQLPQHGRDSLARQQLRQAAEGVCQRIPVLWLGGGELGGRPAQQAGRRKKSQSARITGIGQGIEQPLQGQGSLAGKHIGVAHQSAG